MTPRPVVFDCNVFLQAMISARGPANACWQKAVAGEVTLFIAPFVLAELRDLPDHKKLRKMPGFTRERMERFIEELLEVAEIVSDPEPQFTYPRDPDDTPYVDLAIATQALLIVSNDQDLLDLMDDDCVEGVALRTEHPTFQVLTPPSFLRLIAPPAPE